MLDGGRPSRHSQRPPRTSSAWSATRTRMASGLSQEAQMPKGEACSTAGDRHGIPNVSPELISADWREAIAVPPPGLRQPDERTELHPSLSAVKVPVHLDPEPVRRRSGPGTEGGGHETSSWPPFSVSFSSNPGVSILEQSGTFHLAHSAISQRSGTVSLAGGRCGIL